MGDLVWFFGVPILLVLLVVVMMLREAFDEWANKEADDAED